MNVPRQLQQLELVSCELQQLPAELAGLTRLTELNLAINPELSGGFQRLPHSLQNLHLSYCGLAELPAALADMTRLTQLCLAGNRIEGGWGNLPRQLEELDMSGDEFEWEDGEALLPPDLSRLAQLRRLNLSCRPIVGGCLERLPPQLEQLHLSYCGLRHVPTQLLQLPQLRELSLSGNRIGSSGWFRIPRSLQRLDLRSCDLAEVPYLGGLTQLTQLNLSFNCSIKEGRFGWGALPQSLRELDLTSSVWQAPRALARRPGLTLKFTSKAGYARLVRDICVVS